MSYPQNEKLSQGIALLSSVLTASVTTAVVGPAIDLSQARKTIHYFTAGTLAASETITALIQGCATSGGSYTTITGTSSTLLTSATDSGKTIIVEVSSEAVNDLGLSYRFIQTSVAGAVGSPVNVLSLGAGGPEEPIGSFGDAEANIKRTIVL